MYIGFVFSAFLEEYTMTQLNRRDFVRASMAGFGVAVVSTGITGCILDDEDDKTPVSFNHGVASGDPMTDRVILWTHLNTQNDSSVQVRWDVYEEQTDTLVLRGTANVNATTGHTLKVDATGLSPNTSYYYEFISNGVSSPRGFTKTLPVGSVDNVKFAVVSCANYPAGYFHVYDEIAKLNNLDAVLHLGDYIYEYGMGEYATERATELGRELASDNNTEILRLNDYRKRYQLYRSDKKLQSCHQQHPFITVWDDHEVTNDAYKEGAENHDVSEGDYQTRKMEALQVYFEWMPIRVSSTGHEFRAYRSFQFGDLVDLIMLDTRLEGRDQQLNITNYFPNGNFDAISFNQDLGDPNRTMLGNEQRLWLQQQLGSSQALWQVLGQQVLMGRMLLPAAIVTQALSIEQFGIIAQTAQIGARLNAGDPTVTTAEQQFFSANQALLTAENIALIQQPAIPYNLDAWDGYDYERELILNTADQVNSNLVILAGDTHNAWANNIKTASGKNIGIELATASVTSPGLESFLGLTDINTAIPVETGLTQLITDLQYTNLHDRGYLTVNIDRNEVVADWVFINTIYDQNYNIDSNRAHQHKVTLGSHTLA